MMVFLLLLAVALAVGGVALLLVEEGEQEVSAAPAQNLPSLPPSPEGGATPTFYALSTLPPTATATFTPVATDTPPPTNTPPPTDTPDTPLATDTPEPTSQPTQQSQPPAPTATEQPRTTSGPITSSKGLTVSFQVEGGRSEFSTNESIWFTFQLQNPTGSNVSFGYLGISVEENGVNQSDLFHTTYNETTLSPGDSLFQNYRDHIEISRAGTFTLRLTICHPDVAACDSGAGEWENLTTPITVTVR
jgi:hypothetical protein